MKSLLDLLTEKRLVITDLSKAENERQRNNEKILSLKKKLELVNLELNDLENRAANGEAIPLT